MAANGEATEVPRVTKARVALVEKSTWLFRDCGTGSGALEFLKESAVGSLEC